MFMGRQIQHYDISPSRKSGDRLCNGDTASVRFSRRRGLFSYRYKDEWSHGTGWF